MMGRQCGPDRRNKTTQQGMGQERQTDPEESAAKAVSSKHSVASSSKATTTAARKPRNIVCVCVCLSLSLFTLHTRCFGSVELLLAIRSGMGRRAASHTEKCPTTFEVQFPPRKFLPWSVLRLFFVAGVCSSSCFSLLCASVLAFRLCPFSMMCS